MSAASKGRRSNCPVDYALATIGDRWTLLIIRDLLLFGKKQFSELLSAKEGIATNILSSRLKKLEADGLVRWRHGATDKRRILYELTQKGRDLAPILVGMIEWAVQHAPDCEVSPGLTRKLKNSRSALIAELIADSN